MGSKPKKPDFNWRQNPNKKRELTLKALVYTNAPHKEITRWLGKKTGPCYVSRLNRDYAIRSKAESKVIRGLAVGKTKTVQRKFFGAYSKERKWQLIKENSGGIAKMAKPWWDRSWQIREKYGSFSDFLDTARLFVFEKLDFHNPKGAAAVSSWVIGGANTFAQSEARRLRLEKLARKTAMGKLEQEQLAAKRAGALQAGHKKLHGFKRNVENLQLSRSSLRRFITMLGLNPREAAEAGFGKVKKEIERIANLKKTGLTLREKYLLLGRLNGKMLNDLRKEMPIEQVRGRGRKQGKVLVIQRASIIQKSAVAKMRKALKKK